MTRVAVVDLGTNSTRLLVADVASGEVHEVARRLTVTRLGESVDERRLLAAGAVRRVADCLARYRRQSDALGATRRVAFATSAVRDAADGPRFLSEVQRHFGFETRLLTGDQEALLTFRGVTSARTLLGQALVIDLGGGSTELIVGDQGQVAFHASLDIGCVRLTERFLQHDPPEGQEVAALRSFVRTRVAESTPDSLRPTRGIGVAGTVTTLATLDLGLAEEDPALVDAHMLSRERVGELAESLAASTVAALRRRPGIHPERAPVIGAGALALDEILAVVGLRALEVSETDILHGAALELAA